MRPLLSRAPVYVLKPLSAKEVQLILEQAIKDERGLQDLALTVDDEALTFIAGAADGDARRALGVLQASANLAGYGGAISIDLAREAVQHRFASYDKAGDEHFDLISALHKSVRGSDPDAALYWLARMLDGGENALYIARRLTRMATEDVGLADPAAVGHVIAARDSYQFLGSPEGELALAQAVIYLATAPKSNRAYRAWATVSARAQETSGQKSLFTSGTHRHLS